MLAMLSKACNTIGMQAIGSSFTTAVSDAIRAEVARKHYRQIDLAPVLNISRATLYRRFEEGFSTVEIERIAAFLEIDVQDILDSAEFGQKLSAKAAA